jgi:5-formyltetrahydrofolate cyclo-ligase
MPKKSIRDEFLARRKQLAADACLSRSLLVQRHLLATTEYAVAEIIGLYKPILNEVDTSEIFQCARLSGKKVAYPRVRAGSLEFVAVSTGMEFASGTFGISEPIGSGIVPVEALDLLVVPGVAFDLGGFRLGYGKGFYDRVLHQSPRRGVLAGICFEFQLASALPAEWHDIRMDLLATEACVLRFGHAV